MRLGHGGAQRLFGLAVGAAVLGTPAVGRATWSIVAVDPETREVGVAVASCVEAPAGTTILPLVIALAPGIGALAAQAQWNETTREHAARLLRSAELPPDLVIAAVNDNDPQSAVRQYGAVTLDQRTAAFTGAQTAAWSGDRQAAGVSVQGNVLRGAAVVDDALAAFLEPATGCPAPLADRLMRALEAGAAAGGDRRCSAEQSALAAAIMVARPDDALESSMLDLRVPSQAQGGDNPVALLRLQLDAWRVHHPDDASRCVDAPVGSPTPTAPSVGGCRCSGTPGQHSPAASLLFLLAAVGVSRRNHRRATTS